MLIQESGKVKGSWKLGRVVKADPSPNDEAVRVVNLQYRNENSKSFITVTRAVQRLLIVVPKEQDTDYDEYIKQAVSTE